MVHSVLSNLDFKHSDAVSIYDAWDKTFHSIQRQLKAIINLPLVFINHPVYDMCHAVHVPMGSDWESVIILNLSLQRVGDCHHLP